MPNDPFPPPTGGESEYSGWYSQDQSQLAPVTIPQSAYLQAPHDPSSDFLYPFDSQSGPDSIAPTDAYDGYSYTPAEPFQSLQAPVQPTHPSYNGPIDYQPILVYYQGSYLASPPMDRVQINPSGNLGTSAQFGITPEPQVPTSAREVLQPRPQYLPTPGPSVSPVNADSLQLTVGNHLDPAIADFSQAVDYAGGGYHEYSAWNQQVTTGAELSTYQLQLNEFVSPSGYVQPIHNTQVPLPNFQATSAVPAPPLATNYPQVNEPTVFHQADSFSQIQTYTAPTLHAVPVPNRLTSAKSVHRFEPLNVKSRARRGTLKRQSSTATDGPPDDSDTNKHGRPTWEGHPSVPQGEWREELKRLNLNGDGKYFTQYHSRDSLSASIRGAAVQDYACLYFDPIFKDGCWRRKGLGQDPEWLKAVSNGTRKKGSIGFFPRHEAEMLRHLAAHRRKERNAIMKMPRQAYLATTWQDALIDEQIIKDRDDPDNQFWYADEKRKSREVLDEELSFSSLPQN